MATKTRIVRIGSRGIRIPKTLDEANLGMSRPLLKFSGGSGDDYAT
jgi:hypothetical protein